MFDAPNSFLIVHWEGYQYVLNGGNLLERDERHQKIPDVDVQVQPLTHPGDHWL